MTLEPRPTHWLFVVLAAAPFVGACASGSSVPPSSERTAEAERSASPESSTKTGEEAERRKARKRAAAEVRKLANAAKAYFESEQKYCGGREDCRHPWHDEPGGAAGRPVSFEEYVFPGGQDVTFRTMESIPEGGERRPVDPVLAAGEGGGVADLTEHLNWELPERSTFRYTYTTGPGSGRDATAIIRARADFEPDRPGTTTVVHKLQIDEGEPVQTKVGCGPSEWNDPKRLGRSLREGSPTLRETAFDKLDAYVPCLTREEFENWVVGPLKVLYGADDRKIRARAAEALARRPTPAAREVYLEELQSDSPGRATGARKALVALAAGRSPSWALEFARSLDDARTAVEIYRETAHRADRSTVDELVETLRLDVDEHPIALHATSCEALGGVVQDHPDVLDRSQIETLVRANFLSNERGQSVARECGLAVQKLGAPAIPVLVETFRGNHEGVEELFERYRRDTVEYPPNRAKVVAIQRLATLRAGEAVELFIEDLKSERRKPDGLKDEFVRSWTTFEAQAIDEMVLALGDLGADRARGLLRDAVAGQMNETWSVVLDYRSELQIRQDAADALVRLGDRSSRSLLMKMARDGAVEELERRAVALEEREDVESLPVVRRYRFNWKTARAFALLGTGEDVAKLRKLIEETDGESMGPLREKYREYLPLLELARECRSHGSDAATADCYAQALSSDEEPVRHKAARELSWMSSELAAPRLVEHLSTDHLATREILTNALYRHPTGAAIAEIGDILEAEQDRVSAKYERSHYRLKLLRAWLRNHDD